MKSKILHGENQVQSRKALSEIVRQAKKDGWEISRLSGEGLDKSKLLTAVRSQALFGGGHLVVVENFFANNKNAKKIIQEIPLENGTLVFWEGKALSKTATYGVEKNFEILEFKIPVSVFKFLDSLMPSNTRVALKFLQQAVKDDSADFILLMIARQVRLLIWAKLDPETLKLAPWQKSRIIEQAKEWDKDKLLSFHTQLLDLDRANKRSRLPEDLSASLDLLVAGL
ncbi:MAG: hypothetical protein Q7S60_00290 [bacterium]|nr:hypothetical protein [bacterium]